MIGRGHMKKTINELLENFPYKTIRKEQKYILKKIYNNFDKYDYFVIEAPTGTGKSAIAKTLMDFVNKGSVLLTSTKYLQNQYEQEFQNLFSIKGKNNYRCMVDNNLMCDKGPCNFDERIKFNCIRNKECIYYNKKEQLKFIKSFVTSYSFFLSNFSSHSNNAKTNNLTNANKINRFFDLIILDECHLLENNLISEIGFTINPNKLNEKYDLFKDIEFSDLITITAPLKEGFKNNEKFLTSILRVLKKKINIYSKIIYNSNTIKKDLEEVLKLQNVSNDIEQLKKLKDKIYNLFFNKDIDNWVIEPLEDTLYLQPINIEKYFLNKIDRFTKKCVFLSATIVDMDGFINDLGIDPNKTLKIKVPSTFDYRRSPIVNYPSGNMNYNHIEQSIPTIIKSIKEILNNHKGEKGIIHTNNYKITKQIIDSLNDSRLIYVNDNINNEQLLKYHLRSNKDTVLISPSLYTGVDLKDDLSRFQIIVKLPFLSLGDRRVNKKSKVNKQWYVTEMLKTFIQMCGRSTRHKNDSSVTYVLDSSFYYYIYNNINLFSKSFIKRIIFDKNNFNIQEFNNYIQKENVNL